jgi:hypothetical protein
MHQQNDSGHCSRQTKTDDEYLQAEVGRLEG